MIKYTRHARLRITLRGVSDSEVEKAIKRGVKTRQGKYKIVSCFRHFCVVYRMVNSFPYVITVKPR